MAQFWLGIFIIAIAAAVGWYGTQVASDGWRRWKTSEVVADKSSKPIEQEMARTKQQTVANSPGSVIIQADNVNISSNNEFKAVSPALEAQLISSLEAFKAATVGNPIQVRVDIESGSSLRNKVATTLGNALSGIGLGSYPKGNTFMGVLTDHPVTILCANQDRDIAVKFQQAIEIFLRGGVYIKQEQGFPRGFIRVYMYGQPLFKSDGSVVFQ